MPITKEQAIIGQRVKSNIDFAGVQSEIGA